MVKFSLYSKLVLVTSTLYRRRKFFGTRYVDRSCVTFKYFAFLTVCDRFELLSLISRVQAAMMI